MKKIYAHRFGPLFTIATIALLISFVTRITLLIASAKSFDFTLTNLAGVIGIGLLFDVCFCTYLLLPFVLHIGFTTETIYQKPYKWLLMGVYVAALIILLFTNIVPKDYNSDLKLGINILIGLWAIIFFFLSTKAKSFREKKDDSPQTN